MNALNLRVLAVLVTFGVAPLAQAQEEADQLVEKVAVKNRLYTVEGKWEVGAAVGLSMLPRMTDHYNLNATAAYNLFETFAIEARVGYAISRLTGLARDVQDVFSDSVASSARTATDLSDLWQMNFNGTVGARWQPIYGKFNLVAELPIHFQFYLWAGAGVATFTQESIVICVKNPCVATDSNGSNTEYNFAVSNRVGPVVSLAVGLRFFVWQHHGVRLEVRDWSYLDSYLTGIDRKAAQTNPSGNGGGTPFPSPGITNLVQFDIGYTYIF